MDDAALKSAFLASPYAAVVVSWNGIVSACNRRAANLLAGVPNADADSLFGRCLHEFTLLSEMEVKRQLRSGAARGSVAFPLKRQTGALAQENTVFRITLLRSTNQGELLYLLTQDQLKTTANALSNMNTRRKKAVTSLSQLRVAHSELHESLISIETFSRAASHDIRTPLNTLSGLIELLDEDFNEVLPEKAQNYLSAMTRAVRQMEKLTDELLDHAKVSHPELAAEPVDLGHVVHDIQQDMTIAIDETSGSFTVSGDSFSVMAEPLLLRVLISNIVSNALKYRAPDRPPLIECQLGKTDGDAGHLIIRDNGIGFDQKRAADIFKPFQRLNSAVEGTGIGLSTCSEICQRHGWKISAYGQPGEGAEFTIHF